MCLNNGSRHVMIRCLVGFDQDQGTRSFKKEHGPTYTEGDCFTLLPRKSLRTYRMSKRRVPLSLADLKRKKDEEEARAARPVFLTKDERQQAALERLKKQREEEKAALRADRDLHEVNERVGNGRTRRDYDANGNARRSAKRPRTRFENSVDDGLREQQEGIDSRELEEIRRHYMRIPEKKKPDVKGQTERNRFRYDWDHSEDTMAGEDGYRMQLRKQTASATLQFGRGKIGGMSDVLASAKRKGKTSYLYDTRHWSQKRRSEMTNRDWRIFREDFVISFRASNAPAPNPARSWDETGLPHSLLRLVRDVARYDKPSPIQMATIPIGLEKRDCIGLAETGSGKTAAFVLPMLVHITSMPRMTKEIALRGPYALILAPTRELALQIEAEAQKFAHPLGYRLVHVIGGQGLEEQASSLQDGCEIVVCTPGRMVDLLSKQMAALGNCNYLILDEADRMIDMGFEQPLSEILDSMPMFDPEGSNRRQTFMFSATMSPPVERIAKTYLHDPVIVSVGETGKAADNINQRVEYFTTENRRRERFIDLVETLQPPILVFVNTKGGCEMVSRLLEGGSRVRPVIMHSGKSQDQREKTLEGFRTGRYPVLIATDVVGRGIDIKGIRNVVNFELPKAIEPYTHRIGRTGRAGDKGTAWSLATEADVDLFGPLSHLLEQAGAKVPREIAKAAGQSGRGFRAITD